MSPLAIPDATELRCHSSLGRDSSGARLVELDFELGNGPMRDTRIIHAAFDSTGHASSLVDLVTRATVSSQWRKCRRENDADRSRAIGMTVRYQVRIRRSNR